MKTFKKLIVEMTNIKHAMAIAHDKHFYQIRKFNKEPYSKHPKRVRNTVMKYTKDEDVIIAASLHDTLEDTSTTYREIDTLFGSRVSKLVKELTSDDKEIRKHGKATYLLKKMNTMSSDALLIKLSDRLDNVTDFPSAEKKFVDKYTKETLFILDNIKRPLTSSHKDLINQIRLKLNYQIGFS